MTCVYNIKIINILKSKTKNKNKNKNLRGVACPGGVAQDYPRQTGTIAYRGSH
jgi:hypothetical protein